MTAPGHRHCVCKHLSMDHRYHAASDSMLCTWSNCMCRNFREEIADMQDALKRVDELEEERDICRAVLTEIAEFDARGCSQCRGHDWSNGCLCQEFRSLAGCEVF